MRLIKIILILFLIFLLFLAYTFFDLKKTTSKIEINNIAFENYQDGIYEGKDGLGPIRVITKTYIKDGKIEKIDLLKHDNGLGKEGEKVIDEVIKEQSLEVDTISGATTSSKIILKSIENAFGGNK